MKGTIDTSHGASWKDSFSWSFCFHYQVHAYFYNAPEVHNKTLKNSAALRIRFKLNTITNINEASYDQYIIALHHNEIIHIIFYLQLPPGPPNFRSGDTLKRASLVVSKYDK